MVVATNPFALILVLPSLHAWLWLPRVQSRPVWLRATVLALVSCEGRLFVMSAPVVALPANLPVSR